MDRKKSTLTSKLEKLLPTKKTMRRNSMSTKMTSQTSFLTLSCQPNNCNVTVYANAQASGETLSNTTSVYFQ